MTTLSQACRVIFVAFVRHLRIGLCAFACVATGLVALLPLGNDLSTEVQIRDGGPNSWRAYNGQPQVIEKGLDTNFDGRSDVQEYYNGGTLVRRESDRDFNGQIDLVEEFDVVTRDAVREVLDVDFDGVADLLVLFDGGHPVHSRRREQIKQTAGANTAQPLRELQRTTNDRLKPFQDPFETDLAVRAIRVPSSPLGDINSAQSGGLPRSITRVATPLASSSDIPASATFGPSSAGVTSHSPRGPPSPHLSS